MSDRKETKPPTGTIVKTKLGLWQPVVTLADGTRKRLKPFKKGTSEAMAREKTAVYARQVLELGLKRPTPKGEISGGPMARWFAAWIADRVARGQTSTRENDSHYRLHVAPSVGDKHVKEWSRDDLRKLSADLDDKVRARELSWKTAGNVWGTATRMCSDAAESKRPEIRCRADNPADGVRGPDRGDQKTKEFLYPNEFLAFATCADVPLEWRRIVAVAVYTYLRAGELRVLTWADVNLVHGIIHVHRAHNRTTGETKATKGRRARPVPIELALRPLLQVMRDEAGGEGLVLPNMPSERDMARGLRRWLKRAKVLRQGLHTSSATQRSIVFHDLRGTGCTWMAVRGDDALKIQARAGHSDFATTQGYIRVAEAVGTEFGEPFPALPGGMLSQIRSPESSHHLLTGGNHSSNLRGGRDSNPRPPA